MAPLNSWFEDKVKILASISESVITKEFTNPDNLKMIDEFVKKEDVLALYCLINSNSISFKLNVNEIFKFKSNKMILFVKSGSVQLSNNVIDSTVSINTVADSDLVINIQSQLKNVFEPYFMEVVSQAFSSAINKGTNNSSITSNAERELPNLTKSLVEAISQNMRGRSMNTSSLFNENDISSIHSFNDEYNFWMSVSNSKNDAVYIYLFFTF
jgi:hypothetical protein